MAEEIVLSKGQTSATIYTVGAALSSLVWRDENYCPDVSTKDIAKYFQGSVIAPWANRIEDGEYVFEGRSHALEMNETERKTALHGFSANQDWIIADRGPSHLKLETTTGAQIGYPWAIKLGADYRLLRNGLRLEFTAENQGSSTAPFGFAFHPYLKLPASDRSDWRFVSPARTVMLVDKNRLLPTDTVDVGETKFDFRGGQSPCLEDLDNAFTDLPSGKQDVYLTDGRRRVTVSWSSSAPWLQVHYPRSQGPDRASLVIEPTTGGPNAFNSISGPAALTPNTQFRASVEIRLSIEP